MDRTALSTMAKKSKNVTALRTALRAYFRTEKGKSALANAPLYYGSGLPRQMSVDDAIEVLVEEAATLLTTPKGKKN